MRVAFGLGLLILGCKSNVELPKPNPLPSSASFAGDWESNFGKIHLEQRDNWLYGTYGDKGAFFATANGDQLRFNWRDNAASRWGKGYFVMSRDGQRMDGQYGNEQTESGAGIAWARRGTGAKP